VGLDRDATLALEVHRIEELLLGLALLDRSRDLQKAVGKSRFTVVDVGDDAKIARVFYSHEKAGTIGHSERRVNLKLLPRRKMKGLFNWP
jgi:predicted nucleic acid-binding protein